MKSAGTIADVTTPVCSSKVFPRASILYQFRPLTLNSRSKPRDSWRRQELTQARECSVIDWHCRSTFLGMGNVNQICSESCGNQTTRDASKPTDPELLRPFGLPSLVVSLSSPSCKVCADDSVHDSYIISAVHEKIVCRNLHHAALFLKYTYTIFTQEALQAPARNSSCAPSNAARLPREAGTQDGSFVSSPRLKLGHSNSAVIQNMESSESSKRKALTQKAAASNAESLSSPRSPPHSKSQRTWSRTTSLSQMPLHQSDVAEDETRSGATPNENCFDTTRQMEKLRDYHQQSYKSTEAELERLEVV